MIPTTLDKAAILDLLNAPAESDDQLFQTAFEQRNRTIGNWVFLRGLIEISNICRKDCFYCGIRCSNDTVQRYALNKEEIIATAVMAYENRFGSIAIQGGERNDKAFVAEMDEIIKTIKKRTDGKLGITLSLGEQEKDTYNRWYESGAHRYLLRIETSNESLYKKIHPKNDVHTFHKRLECIHLLQECGYQTGSGIMIGLPFQTTENLADDLLFLKSVNIDMVGMGPYLEHEQTPLYQYRELLLPLAERLRLGVKMIACLRLLMPDINIAATTALQAIDPLGREKGLAAGANVIMPNITPFSNRQNYKLYQNKPFSEEGAAEVMLKLEESVKSVGCRIAFGEWGDSQHYQKRKQ